MSSPPQNTANGTAPEAQKVSPQDVGCMFAQEYYTFMHKEPHKLHCFYGKKSTRVHGTEGEVVTQASGQQEIHASIVAEDFKDRRVEVTNVDSMLSVNGSIIVQVLGKMADNNQPFRRFVQTFFLAEQPSGYYLHNDILRYLKEDADESEPAESAAPAAVVAEPAAEAPVPVAAAAAAAAAAAPVEAPKPAEPAAPKQDETAEADDSAPAPKPAAAAEKKPAAVAKPVAEPAAEEKAKTPKEKPATPAPAEAPAQAPKASAEPAAAPAAPAAPAATKPTSWAHLAADSSSKWGSNMAKVEGTVAPAANAGSNATPTTPSRVSTPGAGPREVRRTTDAASVFLKDIPQGTNIGQLKAALKKFGHVYVDYKAHKTTGIAEFDTEAEKQAALDAGEVLIAGQKVVIEPRRLRTNSGRREGGPVKPQAQSAPQSQAQQGTAPPARSGSGEFERVGSGRGTRSRTGTGATSGNRARGGKQ